VWSAPKAAVDSMAKMLTKMRAGSQVRRTTSDRSSAELSEPGQRNEGNELGNNMGISLGVSGWRWDMKLRTVQPVFVDSQHT